MKKYIIAIVIAVVILVIGGCMSQASAESKGCVTKKEWRTMIWNQSPNQIAEHFGTRGSVRKTETSILEENPVKTWIKVPYQMDATLVRYEKCGRWGAHRFVKVWFVGWWELSKIDSVNKMDEMELGWARA
jgi:hypothetical protein